MPELNALEAPHIIGCCPHEGCRVGGDRRPRQRRATQALGAVLLALSAALLSSGAGANGMVLAGVGGILMVVATAVVAGAHMEGGEGADSPTGDFPERRPGL